MTGAPSSDVRRRMGAIALMTASAACWGFATVISKSALDHAPPMTLLALQLSASLAFLLVMIALHRQTLRFNAAAGRAALAGTLEPGLSYAFGIAGLALTSASNASMIGATEPIVIVLIALLVFRTGASLARLGAIAVAFIGVMFASAAQAGSDGAGTHVLGDAMVALATVFAALYVIVTSRLVTQIHPLPLAFMQQAVGLAFVVVVLAAALGAGLETVERLPSARGWMLIIVSGVVQYALGFWFYLMALRHMPLDLAALFLALIPVFGVGGAVAFLGEGVSPQQGLGCLMIVAAVVWSARSEKDAG